MEKKNSKRVPKSTYLFVLVSWLFDVLASETCDWHPYYVLISVSGSIQEWSEFGLDLIESGLGPLAVVHLVDNDDKLLHTK